MKMKISLPKPFNIALAHALKRDVVMFRKIQDVAPERCTIEVCRYLMKRNIRGSIVSAQDIICEEKDIWKFVRKDSVFIKYDGYVHYIAIVDENSKVAARSKVTLAAAVTSKSLATTKRKAEHITESKQQDKENSGAVFPKRID